MSKVFVVDACRRPLYPVSPCKAKKLLRAGRAAVLRRYPFTLILKGAVNVARVAPLRLKIDPGSKMTGLALVDDNTGEVVFAAEIEHRGNKIRAALDGRRLLRHHRRSRKTRYRKPRFNNRRRRAEWLPPSVQSRVANVETWVGRLRRFAPICAISLELAKFDTQALCDPTVRGVAYQQGELFGYEVREYLLEKWGRRCAYCGAEGMPLEVEHIQPTSMGGTDRVSNLALACERCNQAKGNRPVEEFLAEKPQVLEHLLARTKAPLRNAAAVNAARWHLLRSLERSGLPLETGTGGRTKFNRTRLGLPKAHWLDAACVGASTPAALRVEAVRPLLVKATGHGRRQMCITDRYGFPVRFRQRQRVFCGFRTGDLVRAVVPIGKYAGTRVGRVTVRSSPSFQLLRLNVHPRYMTRLHRADGYDYGEKEATLRPRVNAWDRCAAEV